MRKQYQTRKEIKHFNTKFLATLLMGLIGGAVPIFIYGGSAIILAIGSGLAACSLGLLMFGLVD